MSSERDIILIFGAFRQRVGICLTLGKIDTDEAATLGVGYWDLACVYDVYEYITSPQHTTGSIIVGFS